MIVTRFAPSPTGYLHVGGARTALFNWLLARRTGGKFLLRIEDTDMKRNTATAADQVLKDLKWLGIDWDEGPDIGGPNGPYHQSERRDIYDRYIQQLLDEQKAYYCFDTAEELTRLRQQAETEKRHNLYRRPDRFPDAAEAEQAAAEGRPVTVRFAVPRDETIVIDDQIRGQVRIEPSEMSDFIIRKSDGFPTYHMAVVIDDELMGVTDVIRGQEHLMNTPNHQVLQKALGFRIPRYAHMSVTVSDAGGKLSKRERPKTLQMALKAMPEADRDALAAAGGISAEELDLFIRGKAVPDMPVIDAIAAAAGVRLPEINIVDFFRSGYLPETMVNFLAMLGWNPGDDREILRIDELIAAFDLSRVSKSNSLFDRKKLMAFNTEHLKPTMTSLATLTAHFRAYLEANRSPVAAADDAQLAHLITINDGARTLEQIEQKCRFAFLADAAMEYDDKAVAKVLGKGDGPAMLKTVRAALAGLETLTADSIETLLRGLAEDKQVGLGKVAQPLRVAICGNTVSPPIFEAVQMLGMERTLRRIDQTLARLGNDN